MLQFRNAISEIRNLVLSSVLLLTLLVAGSIPDLSQDRETIQAKLRLDKNNELSLDLNQNPWKLEHILWGR
jgi:hypothetical protein